MIEYNEPKEELDPYEFNPKDEVTPVTEETPVEEPVAEEAPVEEAPTEEDLTIPGSMGLQYQTTDGEIDKGKPLTTPTERVLSLIHI